MDFWEKVKKDIQKGIKEGVEFVREGATVMKKKAGELSEEGKKQYRIMETRIKVQKEMTELGGKVYSISSKAKNPLLDRKVKAIINKIRKFENQIAKLKGEKISPQKATVKKTARKKKPAGS
jgi:hypothetical protein